MGLLQPGRTCWRIEQASRAAFLIDDETYYSALMTGLAGARRQILILGWSFDPRTRLAPGGRSDPHAPDAVGQLLIDLAAARPELDIRVLIWRSAVAISATQGFFPHRAKSWFRGTRVDFRLDDAVPFGACHHQKLVVIDDILAFCGSGDLSPDRWDSAAHADADARRAGPGKSPHAPRHEVMMAVEGPVAAALGELARERWRRAGGGELAAPGAVGESAWPGGLTVDMTGCRVGLARTEPAWGGRPAVVEETELTLAAIAAARRTLYLENQYFASPLIAEALAARLAEPEGPQVVLISTMRSASYFDRLTMDRTRQVLLWRLRAADIFGRFRAFAPRTAGGAPIIVHAKVMVVDNTFARVGSANLNNRSGGFDTECDLAVEGADVPGRRAIEDFGDALAGHWLGLAAADFRQERERGGLIAALDALGHATGRLAPLQPRRLNRFGEFVAALHLGDPAGVEDSWAPFRRRERLYHRVRALRGPSGELEVHHQGQVVGGDAREAVVGRADGQDADAGADEQVVDAEDRHG